MDPSRGCAWVARDARKTYLVNEVLAMIVAELLGPNDAMEVGLHEFLHNCMRDGREMSTIARKNVICHREREARTVDFLEVIIRRGLNDVQY